MPKKMMWIVASLTLACLALGEASGQPGSAPDNKTSITVEEMHCAGCAKRIGGKLYTVPGVATVQYDINSKTLFVTPKANQVPSPRGLWEAVEKAGDRPLRLQNASSVFTTKPQS